MGRFQRPFRGKPHKKHRGPKRVRPNRPHFRDFRKEAASEAARPARPAQPTPTEIPVTQARGPGHTRIMGRIEYDIRLLLSIMSIPPDKTNLYLACAREMYADYENRKPEVIEAALKQTVERWLSRGYDPEIVNRIRDRVVGVFDSLRTSRPPPAPLPDQELTEGEPGL